MTPQTAASRRAGWLLAGAALFFYLATAGGSLGSSDAVLTYEITKSLVERRSLASSVDVKHLPQLQGVDGRIYAPFGIGQSIANVPFYLAGRALGRRLGQASTGSDTIPKAVVALGNVLIGAVVVWLAVLFAYRLSGDLAGASFAALALGFGTLLWPYATFGFNAPLTTACLLAGVYATWIGVRSGRPLSLAWGGVWLACAFLTRHEMVLTIACVGAWLAYESRRHVRAAVPRLLAFGAPLALGAALWLWYNAVRFGDPFNPGYVNDPDVKARLALSEGLLGMLFSPGRSLFVYAPVTLAGVVAVVRYAGRDRSTALLFAALPTVMLLFYSTLPGWDGGRSYGPRYLVPVTPFMLLPLACWWSDAGARLKRILLGLALASIAIQVPAVLVDFSKVSIAHARSGAGNDWTARTYSWREAGLTLNVAATLQAIPDNLRRVSRGERLDSPSSRVQPPADDARSTPEAAASLGDRLQFSLDLWWLYLYYLGLLPIGAALAVGCFSVGAGSTLIWWTCRVARSAPKVEPAFMTLTDGASRS